MSASRRKSVELLDPRPVVLVLGDFSHEGLTAKIEALGFQVVNRRLRSGIKNRMRIVDQMRELNDAGRLVAVFAYLPTPTLLLLAEEEFDEMRPAMIKEMERTRTLLFVYEENLQGTVEPLPWEFDEVPLEDRVASLEKLGLTPEELSVLTDEPWPSLSNPYRKPSREQWLTENAQLVERTVAMVEDLSRRDLELVPFRKRSDVTIRMFEALDDVQGGVFLRIYVPHGRYQSDQFEDFLNLFSRYLREVENREFSIDVERTSRGTTYVFKGRGDAQTVEDLKSATQRFDDFMTVVEADPGKAEALFAGEGITPSDARFLVAKYSRSYRRLKMEMRHEYEQRRLGLAQQLESDILDSKSEILLSGPTESTPASLFSVVGNTAPVTINLAAGAMSLGAQSRAYVEKMIAGNVNYTEYDRELLKLIGNVTNEVEALRLRSELERLKDESTPPDQKRTAAQKLKTFVYKSAKYLVQKADEVGTEVLIRYLESLIKGPNP